MWTNGIHSRKILRQMIFEEVVANRRHELSATASGEKYINVSVHKYR
jgi:hypothetical protein